MSRETEKIFTQMMELFKNFAVTHPVNYPNGQTQLVSIWMNSHAEQEFNRLREMYKALNSGRKKCIS